MIGVTGVASVRWGDVGGVRGGICGVRRRSSVKRSGVIEVRRTGVDGVSRSGVGRIGVEIDFVCDVRRGVNWVVGVEIGVVCGVRRLCGMALERTKFVHFVDILCGF